MKTPDAVVYLEDVLLRLPEHCENVDSNDYGTVGPPKGCKCVACMLARRIDALLNEEWEARCGAQPGQK